MDAVIFRGISPRPVRPFSVAEEREPMRLEVLLHFNSRPGAPPILAAHFHDPVRGAAGVLWIVLPLQRVASVLYSNKGQMRHAGVAGLSTGHRRRLSLGRESGQPGWAGLQADY